MKPGKEERDAQWAETSTFAPSFEEGRSPGRRTEAAFSGER